MEARYRKTAGRIKNFTGAYEFDMFVLNVLQNIAEIMPVKNEQAIRVNDLTDIMSSFKHIDDVLSMPDFRRRLGLPITTLIRMLQMHGHFGRPRKPSIHSN